jgi:hypothetical protein
MYNSAANENISKMFNYFAKMFPHKQRKSGVFVKKIAKLKINNEIFEKFGKKTRMVAKIIKALSFLPYLSVLSAHENEAESLSVKCCVLSVQKMKFITVLSYNMFIKLGCTFTLFHLKL